MSDLDKTIGTWEDWDALSPDEKRGALATARRAASWNALSRATRAAVVAELEARMPAGRGCPPGALESAVAGLGLRPALAEEVLEVIGDVLAAAGIPRPAAARVVD